MKPVHTVKASHKATSKGGKKLRHMIVKPAANGGATVEHQYSSPGDPYGGGSEETHVFPSGKAAGKHVAQMVDGCAPGQDDEQAEGE